jgi:hypothetical protein
LVAEVVVLSNFVVEAFMEEPVVAGVVYHIKIILQ